ncbi:solute carrier family 25 member 44-like [Stylophora pistillata]|uniref:Solute carrier family 25 member 44 n=1 Tax=Stylophora pistillata TaxID=50429 RepID=A0A2B4RTH8_STYPI|nr:solute carrier family 25 member 44-like [Stylophora pistillata]PFX19555.1 Solute carrier family 25 member 44 [Stylophora pistillata]
MPEEVKQIEWQHIDKFKYYTYGSVFFVGVNTLLYPADVIKTRLQVQRTNALYRGTLDAVFKTFRSEGLKGFYKGFLVNQMSILTGHFYVTSYEVSRSQMSFFGDGTRGFVAGGVAALMEQFLANPIEVISQKLMIQGQGESNTKLKGALHISADVFRDHGMSGFYRGFVLSFLTGALWSAVWWGSYGVYIDVIGDHAPHGTSHLLIQSVAGGLSGLNAAVIGNPFDIVKTRLQVEGGKSMTRSFQELLKKEGPKSLTKGMLASILSWVPSSVIMIAAYETVKKFSLKEQSIDLFR